MARNVVVLEGQQRSRLQGQSAVEPWGDIHHFSLERTRATHGTRGGIGGPLVSTGA